MTQERQPANIALVPPSPASGTSIEERSRTGELIMEASRFTEVDQFVIAAGAPADYTFAITVAAGPLQIIQSISPVQNQAIDELRAELEQVKERVTALEQGDQEVIVLRTISKDAAKSEIKELFQSGETLFYSDIARRLHIDLPLVVKICQELEEEGEIEVDADAVQ